MKIKITSVLVTILFMYGCQSATEKRSWPASLPLAAERINIAEASTPIMIYSLYTSYVVNSVK